MATHSPSPLLVKFSHTLWSDAAEREQFIQALTQPPVYAPCILWQQSPPTPPPFETYAPLAWQPAFVQRLKIGIRPGKHPLHDQGAFYCLDFSSIFAASPLLTLSSPRSLVVDMCAAPGGKSLWVNRVCAPHLLLCNEVIHKRIPSLISNLKRCQVSSVLVSSLDSQVLATLLEKTADLVIVDAPCSGQSLLAKGQNAPGCFHPVTLNKNANRQKRILANSAQLVAPQGYLAYMTCTYSLAENEQVCRWFQTKFPHFIPQKISHLLPDQSAYAEFPCYRMWPHKNLGAGGFTILFKNELPGNYSPSWEYLLDASWIKFKVLPS